MTGTVRMAARIARYRLGLFTLSVVQSAGYNGSVLLLGWLLQQVFDALDDSSGGFGVYHVLAMLAGAEAAKMAVIWGGVVETRCWEHMRGLLRLNLLRAQLHSGGPDAGTPAGSPGEALSRFRDDVDDFLNVLDTAIQVAGKVILLAGSMALMISIEPVLALAVALPMVVVVVVSRLAGGRIRAHRLAYRRSSAAVTALLGEMFGAVLAVKTAQAHTGILQHLRRFNERRRRAGLRDELLTRLLGTFNRGTMDLSVGVVLLLAVPATRSGELSVGDLALFVSYISSLIWMPVYAGRMLAQHRQAGVAIERMATLMPPGAAVELVTDRPRPASAPLLPPLDRLAVSGLTAVHPASGRGVEELDLTLDRGTFTVVTGPAGAGKSTLLRAVLGLLPRRAGTVSWNDVEIPDPAAALVPPRSAYVPQVPRLFSESLRDNLLLGAEDDPGLAAAVRTAVLDTDVESMPAGLDTEIGARGVRLSGGQVQRAAIARALVRRTDLLVLDDVSSALDVDTERRLWDRLLADPGRTLLVVSNRPATIARADQVLRLDHGRLRQDPAESAAA
jgi:ATP-binding cassette, subfamily B, bacterial